MGNIDSSDKINTDKYVNPHHLIVKQHSMLQKQKEHIIQQEQELERKLKEKQAAEQNVHYTQPEIPVHDKYNNIDITEQYNDIDVSDDYTKQQQYQEQYYQQEGFYKRNLNDVHDADYKLRTQYQQSHECDKDLETKMKQQEINYERINYQKHRQSHTRQMREQQFQQQQQSRPRQMQEQQSQQSQQSRPRQMQEQQSRPRQMQEQQSRPRQMQEQQSQQSRPRQMQEQQSQQSRPRQMQEQQSHPRQMQEQQSQQSHPRQMQEQQIPLQRSKSDILDILDIEIPLEDAYSLLKVDVGDSTDVIKKAYRKLVLKYHPDRGGDVNKFNIVEKAYNTIMGEYQRREYKYKDVNELRKSYNNEMNIGGQRENIHIKKDKFNINKFNKVFDKYKIETPHDKGYGDIMSKDTNREETIAVKDTKYEHQDSDDRVIIYKEPVPMFPTNLEFEELGVDQVNDFGVSGKYTDYKQAHTTQSRLIDAEKVKFTEYKSLNDYKKERGRLSYDLSAEDKRLITLQQQSDANAETKRLSRLRNYDTHAEENYKQFNRLFIGNK
jgi:curved DNA-binding protein CbpA